ncbi:MAG: protein kinase domain-containing protein, partial [Planctomycetota bacterium]
MSAKPNKIEAIYSAALEKRSDAERSAFLDNACGNDSTTRTRVEALLRANSQAGDFLKIPPSFQDVPTYLPIEEAPGTIIDRYKLLEKIGEGGMAVVYMAEQQKPIRRKVALKIIKLGMDTKSVIARFEAERQALAMMDHPNIAKVLDAGATETGRPYFVMELVTGVSITEYCDKNSLSTKERLNLFIQVCNAVQHAHQKGIIHRDIKPTNVMVTRHEGESIPKVIDFGIAKATNQRLTEKTLFTRYAHIIGTPAYMSPEQADLSDFEVDTRSDIYSLGILLYELLTGTTPFSEEELRKAGYLEMRRIIREKEPAKPSTKLTTLGETLTDIAKHRSATPDILTKAIRDDLDWIVMKALEKDRTRRYEGVASLSLDIERHLEHEPVLARSPSTTYLLHKFLRRHRSKTIAALLMLTIVGALTVILSMWNRDRLQLAEAESFRHRGILSQAREQYTKMDRKAALLTIKPILNSKHVGSQAQLLYAGILVDNRLYDEAVAMLGDLRNKQPEIAGAAHSLLARILWESESPDADKLKEIEEHRKRAEVLLPETAEAYFLRAMTAITVKEQLACLDRALQLNPGHYESRRLRAFTYYASRKYEKTQLDVEVMVTLAPKDPLGYSLRAIALRELGRFQEAIADFDSTIALTPREDPRYIDLCAQRSEVLLRMGNYERSITEARKCLKLSPSSPVFQYHIFCALTALGDYEKADTVFQQIVNSSPTARNEFWLWSAKHIFETLGAGRSWHPTDHKPAGAAFLPMLEAEKAYNDLSAKGRRVTTDGFSARWSPDGSKLAFSLGFHGYSGVAIFNPATNETELLIVPGKDPKWSPDGKYIAFVRDCQLLRLEELTTERQNQHRPVTDEEVWIMKSDGTEPRRLAQGSWPSWGRDSEHIYYQSREDGILYSLSLTEQDAESKRIMKCSNSLSSVSPDNQRLAYFEGGSLKIIDLVSQKSVVEC